MEITSKVDTITLHHGKAAKTMLFEVEIFDYGLYSFLEMLLQEMKLYLNYEVWMKHLEKNLGVHFKNCDK